MTNPKAKEAIEFAKEAGVALMVTISNKFPIARAMEIAELEDDFTVWFSTNRNSAKIEQIKNDPNTCVLVWVDARDLRIFGHSEIVEDKSEKDAIYKDKWDRHYPNGGKDDPDYAVIKIKPIKVEYRDMQKYGNYPEVIFSRE